MHLTKKGTIRLTPRAVGALALVAKARTPDGTPADPPTLRTAVPNWEIGDKIP
jgi:hypothetical protein